ncbi:OmpA family protein [Sphingopyxis sp. BSN-002]|uniref:OmpA family protein n=1 Tax=Sphingopyxis sp. BSN-002 TaxID=2911495 RepID=UPI001ED9E3A3|nr:OmpA family protein [Sphingopyxis sp. BSN-002]UKK85990.1 OmpA family protein [Sphingopyxis sp. BSN-002]
MRKLAVAMALASTALASPALARDNSWYVGVGGGVMIVEDMDLDIGTVNNAGSLDHRKGYDVEGTVGYDFGGFRAEVEVGYKEADITSGTFATPGIPQTANGSGAAFTGATPLNGDSNALSFMVNGLLDFGDDDGLQGFIGGGAGVARVSVEPVFAGAFLDDSDTGFAWQAIAGVRAPLTKNWDVGLKYRFFNASNLDLVDQLGRDVSTRFRSHSILGTLTYNFGGAPAPVETPQPPAPPPPAPPPPTPPAPPPAPVCDPGPYIVYFDWDQSNITPEAAATLDNAISAYNRGCTGQQVWLAGHADRSGSAKYNVGLSERRNTAVRGYLTARGISDGSISSEAFGESRPAVATADGVRNDQNRRVEIKYGPGSGN